MPQTDLGPSPVILVVEQTDSETQLDGGWELILYNDEVNSRHHVARSLTTVCQLSDDQAYDVMMTAHKNGTFHTPLPSLPPSNSSTASKRLNPPLTDPSLPPSLQASPWSGNIPRKWPRATVRGCGARALAAMSARRTRRSREGGREGGKGGREGGRQGGMYVKVDVEV